MNKVYTLLLAALMIASAATAKRVNLRVSITSPANGTTLTAGGSFQETAIITNLGPDAIAATDTFFYQDPANASGQVWYRVGLTKAMNDTIFINKGLSIPATATNGTFSYCILAYASNGATITADSNYFESCNTITITGGSTSGVGGLVVTESVETQNLSMFPNPAAGMINMDFKAQNSTEVTAKVTDIAGRVVMVYNFGKAYNGQTGYKLDLSSLNTGLYLVEMRQEGVRAIGKTSRR